MEISKISFTQIPNNALLKDSKSNNTTLYDVFNAVGKKLVTGLFTCYAFLYSYQNYYTRGDFNKRFFIPVKRISSELGLNAATVSKHLGTLKFLNLIQVYRISGEKDSRCNEYIVNKPTNGILINAYKKALVKNSNNLQTTIIVKAENSGVNAKQFSPIICEVHKELKRLVNIKEN